MKIIKLKTVEDVNVILVVEKIASIVDNIDYRTVSLVNGNLIHTKETVDEILNLING